MHSAISQLSSRFRLVLFTLILLIASICFVAAAAPSAYAETGGVRWGNVYGGSSDEGFYDIVSLDDGGFVAVGASNSTDSVHGWGNEGSIDAIAARFDANGALVWSQNYGGAQDEYFYGAAADGTYLYAVGWTGGPSTNLKIQGASDEWGHIEDNDALFVKIDLGTGNAVFGGNMGGDEGEAFEAVTLTNAGTLCMVGTSNGFSSNLHEYKAPEEWENRGSSDAIAVEFDPSRYQVLWARSYGGQKYDTFQHACFIPGSNGIYVAGHSLSSPDLGAPWDNQGKADAIAMKINTSPGAQSGVPQWTQNYGGPDNDYFEGIAVSGTSLYFAGLSADVSDNLGTNNWENLGQHDMILVKAAASDGTPEWAQNFGGDSSDAAYAIDVAPDGSIYLVGESQGASTNVVAQGAPTEWSNQGDWDAVALKLKPSASGVAWALNCGSPDVDTVRSVCTTPQSDAFAAFVSFDASTNIRSLGAPNEWGAYGNTDALVLKLSSRYTLNVVNGTDVRGLGAYFADTSVPIRANAAAADEVFASWSSNAGGSFAQAENSETSFTMPAADSVVTAAYKPATPTPGPGPHLPATGDSPVLCAIFACFVMLFCSVIALKAYVRKRGVFKDTKE